MKSYIIRIDDHKDQNSSAKRLIKSIYETGSDLDPVFFSATTPDTINSHLYNEFHYFNKNKYRWNYPTRTSENHLDLSTGLYKSTYSAADQRRVEACLISHMRLWDKCVFTNEPMIIFEADAILIRKFELDEVKDTLICGLNDPIRATRRAKEYHHKVSSTQGLQRPPIINLPNENPSPQGIAGNSAYYIVPEGAKKLLDLVSTYGGWPNDAIMCRELIPELKVVYPYFTRVQGTQSTTTG